MTRTEREIAAALALYPGASLTALQRSRIRTPFHLRARAGVAHKLFSEGWSQRDIAAVLGLHKETVRSAISRHRYRLSLRKD